MQRIQDQFPFKNIQLFCQDLILILKFSIQKRNLFRIINHCPCCERFFLLESRPIKCLDNISTGNFGIFNGNLNSESNCLWNCLKMLGFRFETFYMLRRAQFEAHNWTFHQLLFAGCIGINLCVRQAMTYIDEHGSSFY